MNNSIEEVVLKDVDSIESVLEKIISVKKEGCFNPKTVYYEPARLTGYKTTNELLEPCNVSPFNRKDSVGAMKLFNYEGKEVKVECPEHHHPASVLLVLKDVVRWDKCTHDLPYTKMVYETGYYCEEERVFHTLPNKIEIGPCWV